MANKKDGKPPEKATETREQKSVPPAKPKSDGKKDPRDSENMRIHNNK
jgi:hypothetical protein